jgi:hypothetical protein
MKHLHWRRITGWSAVGISTALSSFWAFWGGIENFHEGWYYESLLWNLGLMLVQYLSGMLVFMLVALLALSWPRVGAGLHIIMAIGLFWLFGGFTNSAGLLITVPLALLGLLYWFGRPQPRRLAVGLLVGLPVLTLLLAGAYPAWRVFQRVNDGNLATRIVEGNGVRLVWAPAGPGWPEQGVTWEEAILTCRHLGEDDVDRAAAPQEIWRLPTVDEAVRSMALHGENSGGVWNAQQARASYVLRPDKETPLWNSFSPVIYWWTATEVDAARAYIIAYDGSVWPREKQWGPDYLGFRCVKQP